MATPKASLLFFFAFLLNISTSQAKDFLVGGTVRAWKVPSSPAESLNRWAEATRFQVGDSLVWKFDGEKDSVLRVSRENYFGCRTEAPMEEYKDGKNAVLELNKPGPYYFISGAPGACEQGEKLIVVVMSPRHRLAPAPGPAESEGPAVAPTSSGSRLAAIENGLAVGLLLWTLF